MAGIFDGMEKFGLSVFSNVALFAEPEKEGNNPKKAAVKEFNINDYIYNKEFTCPVCNATFNSSIMRTGKTRLVTIEYNLRPIYEPVNPLFYDIVLCEKCGYSAIKQQFLNITERQIDLIKEKLLPNYKRVSYPQEINIELAIERYKLTLLNAIIKNAKNSEKAYICMKMYWLYIILEDAENKLLFARHALDGFQKAFIDEKAPFMGMDENTLIYLLAVFSKEVGETESSLRYLSTVVTAKSASPKLKDRARDLKETIKAEKV